ncbi:MAG: hypothetical protein AAGE43_07865 [Pseudomonadota bacterium]
MSISTDPRLDPRIKAMMGAMPTPEASDAESREQLLAEAASDEAMAAREAMAVLMEACDDESVAPSAGLAVSTKTFTSAPDVINAGQNLVVIRANELNLDLIAIGRRSEGLRGNG